MDPARQLVKLSDLARTDGVRGLLHRAKSALSSALLGSELEERLSRVSADLAPHGVDPFGWDPNYARYVIAAAAKLSKSYFRTIVQGIENLPAGRVLLVANHSGQIPLDGVIIAISVFLEANPPRFMRAMVEKWTQTLPFVSTLLRARRPGRRRPREREAPARARRGAARLSRGRPRHLEDRSSKRYQLADFGLGFMRLAIETGHADRAGRGHRRRRAVHLASATSTRSRRLLAHADVSRHPAAPLPGRRSSRFPRRYRIYFGEPMRFGGDPDDDDAVIEEKVCVVKATIQSMLNRGLKERKSLFF